MIDIELLEKELTAFFASLLGMTLHENICQGSIPHNGIYRAFLPYVIPVRNCAALRIVHVQSSNEITVPVILVQILGKYEKREDALQLLTKIESSLPRFGESTTHFRLNTITKDYSEAPFAHADHGAMLFYASYHIKISVLTVPNNSSN